MICQIDIVLRELPLMQDQIMGGGSARRRQESVFIKVTNSQGQAGTGEASAWPLFGGHCASGHRAALAELFGPLLLGFEESEWAGLENLLRSQVRGCELPRAAAEMAVLDLAARTAGVPLGRLFGGRGTFELGLSYSVSLQDPAAERDIVSDLYGRGYRAFKLKTGVLSPEHDVARLLSLRDACPDATLRMDYNECATDAGLRAILGPAREVGVEYCEQPYPAGQERRLAMLRRWFDVPISLDESVTGTADLLRVAEQGVAEFVSLKCGKVGGLSRMVKMADLAAVAGITPYAGSLSETRLGVGAALGALSAVGTLAFGSDFYFPFLIVDDRAITGGPRVVGGAVAQPGVPGHGCELPADWWQGESHVRLAGP